MNLKTSGPNYYISVLILKNRLFSSYVNRHYVIDQNNITFGQRSSFFFKANCGKAVVL